MTHNGKFCLKSGLLWWENIGKVANQMKLAIPSHSDPLWWEKIRKVANQAKLVIPSHSEPLQWEKITKLQLRQNPTFLRGGGGKSSRTTMSC